MRQAYLLIILSCLWMSQAEAQLVINEVCASNYGYFIDNYGENEDWIELYNGTGADIDLLGYYLSDDVAEPLKYQIDASVNIAAGGYRLIHCSNRGEVVGNNIHTSFKINQQNQEYAVLSDPSGTTIDLLWLDQKTQQDHSRGRVTDGAASYGVFTNPSPGAANAAAMTGYASTPTFDTAPGLYAGAIDIVASSPDAGVTLRYGLNGDFPTAASPVWPGSLNIAATTTVHVRAFSNDPMVLPSFMETNTYFIDETHTVPMVSISGPNLETLLNGTQFFPVGHFELFGADGQLWDEAHGDFNEHGNDSWAYAQRGFDYITRDQLGYNDELHYPIFRTKDRPAYQRLIIKAAANDNYPFSIPPGGGAHMIDAYVHSISQIADLRLDERSYEPCVLYLNGQYWGLYELREKVDDFDFTDYYYDQGEGEVQFMKTWGGTWSDLPNIGGGVAPSVQASWDEITDLILTNDMSNQANYEAVKDIYNVGSLIDYFVLNSYVVTTDWLNWNTGWWRGLDPDGDKRKWRYILWDNDASFGQYINFTGVPDTSPEADPCNPESLGDPGGQGHVPILNALLNNEEFYNDYVSRMVDLSQSYFSCDFMIAHIDSLENMLMPEMQQQCDRWGGNVADWQGNVEVIRQFIIDRCAAINEALVDCYDVEGPYPVTVQVMPPGAGWVEFNTIDITEFPWEGEYFGNLEVELEANGYGINVFSHWETNNHVFDNFYSDTVDFTFTQSDTIVAWFVTETTDVLLETIPDDVGEITVGPSTYSNLPETVTVPQSVTLDLIATSTDPFYAFDHWETDYTAINPDQFTDEAEIEFLLDNEHVRAHFVELENYFITIDIDIPEGGEIYVNGELITDFPTTIQILAGDTIYITGSAAEFFTFNGWLTDGITLVDGDMTADNSFIVSNGGTITGSFLETENYTVTYLVEPVGTGQIAVDGELLEVYPTTIKYYAPDLERNLVAIPEEFHEHSHWELSQNILNPDEESEVVSTILMANDTITAHFVQDQFGYFLPNAFSPNGDGINDIYYVTGHAVEKEFYSLSIFDRNGQIVFQTDDMSQGWNGAAREDSNYYAADGIYVYRLQVRSVFGDIEEAMGHILLTR